MPQTNQPKIFISHSWEDKPLVRRLENELQAAGAEVWVDHEGIRGGDNLPERISEALEWCNTLVLVWTKAASQSRWVNLEWTNAISLEKTIIPCRVDNAALPAILAHKAYVGFNDVEAGLAQLLRDLRLRTSPPFTTKTDIESVLRLRSTPVTLSRAKAKAMLRKYDFYCKDHRLSKNWSNPQGKGISHKFELQQNGQVVFDHATGLMWQQSGSSELMSFAKAEKYVCDLNAQRFARFNGWRLPTLEEAMSLIGIEANNAGLFIDSMFDREQGCIWTSDKCSWSWSSWRWVVLFSSGGCYEYPVGVPGNARLVR